MKTFALLVASIIALFGACSAPLSPKAQADIAAHASALEKCQAEGKDAGKGPAAYAVYEGCTKDAGLQ